MACTITLLSKTPYNNITIKMMRLQSILKGPKSMIHKPDLPSTACTMLRDKQPQFGTVGPSCTIAQPPMRPTDGYLRCKDRHCFRCTLTTFTLTSRIQIDYTLAVTSSPSPRCMLVCRSPRTVVFTARHFTCPCSSSYRPVYHNTIIYLTSISSQLVHGVLYLKAERVT